MPYRLTLNPDSKTPEVLDLAAFLGADDEHTITHVIRYLLQRRKAFSLEYLEPVTGPDPRD